MSYEGSQMRHWVGANCHLDDSVRQGFVHFEDLLKLVLLSIGQCGDVDHGVTLHNPLRVYVHFSGNNTDHIFT